MKLGLKLILILCTAVAICSVISHGVVLWLGVKTTHSVYQPYGRKELKPAAILLSSSVGYNGIDWERVSEVLHGTIESWATGGATPSEWEHMQHLYSANVSRTFIVVSPVDLNEYSLCDVRAEIVPLSQTVLDLWQVRASGPFSKMVLSQYPMRVVRWFFPTVGRSDGVMTGIRDQLSRITQRGSRMEAGEAVKFGRDSSDERVSDWEPARFQRRMAMSRAACKNKHYFNGIKKAALKRLFQKALRQGEVTWIVLPLSPFYQNEFLTPAVRHDFEMALVDLQRSWPQARLIRLDQLPLLQDNGMFSDFVHLNRYGQQIATNAFLSHLEDYSNRP